MTTGLGVGAAVGAEVGPEVPVCTGVGAGVTIAGAADVAGATLRYVVPNELP
jgi:hypothetical protein